jgi:hypothetical protein
MHSSGYDVREPFINLIQFGSRKLMPLSACVAYSGIYMPVNRRL